MSRFAIDKRALVSSIPIFSQLTSAELDALLGISMTRAIGAREILFRKGDRGDELFAVMEGRVKATTPSAHGKEAVFSVMGPGEVFGEIALFDGRPRSATVEAIEPSRLIAIHRSDFLPFVDEHAGLALKLLAMVATRMRSLSGLVEDMLFLRVPSRLAKRLLVLSRIFGAAGARGPRIQLKLSAQDLGDLIGAPGESVERQLRLWVQEGLIALEGGEIELLAPEGLETLADLATL